MSGRFENVQHVLRVIGLFAGALVVFILLRSWFVPSDFGVEGFYRAGARVQAQGLPLVYAGEAECITCHTEPDELRKSQRHAGIKCEACHGPLLAHALDSSVKPTVLDPEKLCLTCHQRAKGKPALIPQIVAASHEAGVPCTACHKPHQPRMERPKGARQ